jgi:hypothetical protein
MPLASANGDKTITDKASLVIVAKCCRLWAIGWTLARCGKARCSLVSGDWGLAEKAFVQQALERWPWAAGAYSVG